MYIYYCWITALIPSYQDGIVAGMVRKGYMVGPAAKDGKIVSGEADQPAALIALSVYRAEETDVKTIYGDIILVLGEMKAHYHSIIVSLSHDATWVGPNIKLPAKEVPTSPPLPPGVKKNMN